MTTTKLDLNTAKDINNETFNQVVEKIKKRDELMRAWYRNETDKYRLSDSNDKILEEVDDLDRTILIMLKPKEEKKDG